jgi:hypothetical protein
MLCSLGAFRGGLKIGVQNPSGTVLPADQRKQTVSTPFSSDLRRRSGASETDLYTKSLDRGVSFEFAILV